MWTYTKQMVNDLSPGVKRFIATESLFGVGAGISSLILNLHVLELGFSKAFIGQITSLSALTIGLASLPAGLVVKRLGRKPTLVVGMMFAFLALALFGISTTKEGIIAAQLVWSLGITAVVNSEIQLIFQYCRSKREETSAYSLLFAVFTLFTGVGTWLGGYLSDWLPGHTTRYQYAFLVAAGCLLLGGILRGLLLPSARAGEEVAAATAETENAALTAPEQAAPEEAAMAQGVMATREHDALDRAAVMQDIPVAGDAPEAHDRDARHSATTRGGAERTKRGSFYFLLMLSLLIFNSGFTFGLLNPFLNVILKFRYDMGDGAISGLLALSGIFLFAGSLAMPYCVERWGSRRTFALLFLYNIVVVALMAAAMPAAAFAVLLLVRGSGFTMLNNLMDSECMSAVPEDERNLFAGMRTVSRSVGNTIASYWAGYILAGGHYALPFLLTAAALAAGFAFFVRRLRGAFERTVARGR